jgi:hypothetical protein
VTVAPAGWCQESLFGKSWMCMLATSGDGRPGADGDGVAGRVGRTQRRRLGVTVAHRVLLVANRTLGDPDVLAAVRQRVDAGATDLWIVAPVTTPSGVLMAGAAPSGEALPVRNREPDAAAYDLAERRLDAARERFGALGIDVGGEVGDPDPFTAVSKAMDRREFAEVVLSTLPSAVSQWLRLDLASRVQRRFKVPVITVTGHAD